MSEGISRFRRVLLTKGRDQAGIVMSVSLFVFLAFSYASLAVLLILIVALLLAYLTKPESLLKVLRSLVTPYLPFVILLLVAGLVFPGETSQYMILTVVVSYLLARVVVAIAPLQWILAGAGLAGFFVVLGRQIGVSSLAIWVPFSSELANITDKNPTGWTGAFGLVALAVLLLTYVRTALGFVVLGAIIAGLSGLLVFVDSLTSLLAVIVSLVAVAVILFSRSFRQTSLRRVGRIGGRTILAVGLALVAVVAALNLSGPQNWPNPGLLQRDFSSITGRDTIWLCYFDTAIVGRSDTPWADTKECAGGFPQHLHNIFLESHLIGGIPLSVALIIGIVWSLVWGIRHATRAVTPSQFAQSLFTLGIAASTLTIGMAESFIFWELVFGAVVVFVAAPTLLRETKNLG